VNNKGAVGKGGWQAESDLNGGGHWGKVTGQLRVI
jgi:hypothetical protein